MTEFDDDFNDNFEPDIADDTTPTTIQNFIDRLREAQIIQLKSISPLSILGTVPNQGKTPITVLHYERQYQIIVAIENALMQFEITASTELEPYHQMDLTTPIQDYLVKLEKNVFFTLPEKPLQTENFIFGYHDNGDLNVSNTDYVPFIDAHNYIDNEGKLSPIIANSLIQMVDEAIGSEFSTGIWHTSVRKQIIQLTSKETK